MTNEEKIIEKYFQVKALGWVVSRRRNNTGIGKTFEDYVGVVENNLDEPDLFGYEIKSHRAISQSYVTLFTKAPSYPKGANQILKETFGDPYPDNPNLKHLHTSMFANRFNTYKSRFSFRLRNDRENEKIVICVYDLEHNLLDDTVGYFYDDLKSVLLEKLNKLFYVEAERDWELDKEKFFFNHARIYTTPQFDIFLDMIDSGEIMYDIRIGSYKSGRNKGRAHDHGSGFRIQEHNITKLYGPAKIVD